MLPGKIDRNYIAVEALSSSGRGEKGIKMRFVEAYLETFRVQMRYFLRLTKELRKEETTEEDKVAIQDSLREVRDMIEGWKGDE